MNHFNRLLLSLLVALPAAVAQATPVSYAGPNSVVRNCFPFGCPDSFGPHMGFIYKDIKPFTLKAGDKIAFDTGLRNDQELHFDLSLAATTVNGGTTANAAGFTLVSSLGPGFFGDTTVGNYDIVFIAANDFSFAGDGLIVDFVNTNGLVVDVTTEQNLVSSDSPFAVGRYFNATEAGNLGSSGSTGTTFVGNIQIDASGVPMPEPASLSLVVSALLGLAVARRRRPV